MTAFEQAVEVYRSESDDLNTLVHWSCLGSGNTLALCGMVLDPDAEVDTDADADCVVCDDLAAKAYCPLGGPCTCIEW